MSKYRAFSIINVVGLGFGIACCLLIMIFVRDELSYDRYHEKSDRIYRVALDAVLNNNAFNGVVTCGPLAQALVDEFAEVEVAARVRNYGFPVFRYKDKVFSEERVFWVDSTFFDVFTVPFLKGNPRTALSKPETIVLTRSMAEKYFGDEDPIGKSLNSDLRRDYVVTGVIEDVPRTTHFHYDFLASLYSYQVDNDISWVSNNYHTYFVIKEGASAKALEDKLSLSVNKHAEPQVQAALGISMDQFFESGGVYRYFFQQLREIHLQSHLDFEIEPNGNYSYVLIFSIIAVGILLVACINFINLSTARACNRAKEVGIRKTVGSGRGRLVQQFLIETIFLSFLAMLIALVLVHLFLPSFNNLSGKELDNIFISHAANIPLLIALIILIGILAGAYPAFFLASFHPVSVIRGDKRRGGRRSMLRNILVVFQFTVSIILIISTLIVRRQVDYIQTKDLGFDKEDVIIVNKTDDLADRLNAFKQALLENANIKSVSNTTNLFGNVFGNNVFLLVGETGKESHLLWTIATDADFAKAYGIGITAGRYFEENREADLTGCILNESAVKTLGIENPVGKELTAPDDEAPRFQILGVVEDFHFESMHQVIRPLILLPFQPNGRGRYVAVKIQPGSAKSALGFIEKTWREFAANQAFEYEFFEDHFARIYLPEKQTGQIFFVFSLVSIIIACLGLFGLATFIAEQRTKEIGIRKVLGATVPGVFFLLSRQFAKWVLVSTVIAWPLAFLAMHKWLQNFAYKAPFSVSVFVFSALFALLIAALTVSLQSAKAAITNPVNSLRYE